MKPCTRIHPCRTARRLWSAVARTHHVWAHIEAGNEKVEAWRAYQLALRSYETHVTRHGAPRKSEQVSLLEVQA